MSRTLFASLVSQSENLGDLVIRRNALSYGFPDQPVVALATGMPKEYLDSFNLPAGSRCVQSSFHFQALLVKALIGSRVDFLLAPGPVVLSGSLRSLLKSFVVTVNCIIVRLSGGNVWSLGRSYRGRNFLANGLEKVQSRVASKYYVRDQESTDLLGSGVSVKPDMAFADDVVSGPDAKNYVAVSLRSYCEDSLILLENLVKAARRESLEVILVTQVKFDESLHEDLAGRLGVEHVGWGDRSHVEQLQVVSHVYSNSAAIVSNRLHALIFGLRCGAVAVAFEPEINPKLESTLRGWVPVDDAAQVVDGTSRFFEVLPELRCNSMDAWNRARRELLLFLKK